MTKLKARVGESWQTIHPVPVVNSLPASPDEGDEIYYRFMQGAAPTLWHLRYNGSSWDYLGGGRPWYAYSSTYQILSSTSWVTRNGLTPVGPLPLTGGYRIDWSATLSYSMAVGSDSTTATMLPAIGATGQLADQPLTFGGPGRATVANFGSGRWDATVQLGMIGNSAGGSASLLVSSIMVTPTGPFDQPGGGGAS